MTVNPHKSRIVKDNGEVLEAHFYNSSLLEEGIAALQAEGLEVITGMELAEARAASKEIPPVVRELWSPQFNCIAAKIREPGSPILTDRILLAENFNYMLNGDILVASREYSPLLKHPEKAAELHKYGKELYLDESTAKELMSHAETDPEKAIKSGVLLIPYRKRELTDLHYMDMPTMYLEGYPLAQFLFRDFAGPYGRFLNSLGETSIPVAAVPVAMDKEKKKKANEFHKMVERQKKLGMASAIVHRSDYQEKPFARPLVMGHIDYPLLDGDNEDVYNGYYSIRYGSVCGIRRINAGGAK